MGKKNFKNTALKAGMFLVGLSVLFFTNLAPARASFFGQAKSYFSEGSQTFGNAAGQFGSSALNAWQKVGDGLGDATGVIVKNATQASDAFLGGIKNFGESVGGLGSQTTKGYDAALGKVKQGTDKVAEKVINILPKKTSVKVAAPKSATKNETVKTEAKESVTAPAAAVEVKPLPEPSPVVQKEEKKKSSSAAPKEIIIYSNKANQESVQSLAATSAKASPASDNNYVTVDAATGIATLKGIKIIGTVDFTGADVKGFKQTVVNNYSSGGSTPLVVYNSTSGNYENRTSISGNYGGVSEHFSVGKDLTVSNAATIGAGGLTIGTATANSSLTVNGTAAVTGATTLSGAATLSSDLTVNGNTTLGDVAGDTITINGRLSTLNVSDGSTTSSLAKNSFYIAADSSNALGKFYVDLSGNVTASGTITSSGGITMSGHLAPSSDNLYDVGSSSTQWRYGNFQGGLLVADGSTTSTLLNNTFTLGQTSGSNLGKFYVDSSGNVSATGSLKTFGNVTSTGHIYPASANTVDLGSNILGFRDIFASSSLYIGNVSGASTTLRGNYLSVGNGTSSTVLNGSSLTLGSGTNYGSGMFNVDLSGNVSASGTLNLTNTAVTSTIAGGLTVDTNSLVINHSNGRIGIGTTGPMATVHIGNGTTNGSSDSQVLISRLVDDTTSGNGHAFSDSSNISRSGTIGYNSYDARVTFSGSSAFDHYAGYQFAPTYASAGAISNIYGFYSLPSLSTGNITNYYGIYTANPSNTATLNNNYGVYVANQTAGTNNWGVFVSASGTATNIPLEIRQPTGTGSMTQILLNRDSANTGDQNLIKWKSSTLEGASIGMEVRSASAADLVFSTNSAGTTNLIEKMRITGGGNIGVNTTTPGYLLTINSANNTDKFFQIASTTNQNIFVVDQKGRVGIGTATFDETYDGGIVVQPISRSRYTFRQQDTDGSNSINMYLVNTGESTFEMNDNAGNLKNFFYSAGSSYITGGSFGVGDSSPLYLFTVGSGDKFGVNSSGDVFASGSIKTFGNVTSTGHIYPASANSVDLGSNILGFRDIFASSSLYIGNVSGASTTLRGNYLAVTNGTSSTILNGSSLQLGVGASTGYGSGMFNVDSNGNVSASGTVLAAAGTAALPAFSFVGDPNTGFWNYAGDTIGISSAGATIGTIGTGSTLDFNTFRAFNNVVMTLSGRAADGATAINVQLQPVTVYSTAGAKLLSIWNGPSGSGGVEKAYVDLNGSIGLAVTAGTFANGKFNVDSSGNVSASGSIKTYGNVTSTGNLYALNGTASTSILNGSSLQLGVGASTGYGSGMFNVDSSGNVSVSGTLAFTNTSGGTVSSTAGALRFQGFNSSMVPTAPNPEFEFWNGGPQGAQFLTIGFYQGMGVASTTFTSYIPAAFIGNPGNAGFVLNTIVGTAASPGAMASTTGALDRALLAVQNNGVNQFVVSPGGNVYADESFIANSNDYGIADMAEYVNLTTGETGEPGDVLVVDLVNPNKYKKSSSAYTKEIAGVISDTGAFLMGASGEGRAPLALAGLVKTKVTDENGPIAVGDYLVSASKSGYAMKYDSASGKSAGLVGMALEPLTEGEGKIIIMVNKGLVAGGGSTVSLTVNENGDGTISGGENWDFGGKSILNVKSISGANGLWYIDEKGLLMAKEIKADKVQAKKFVVEKETDLKKASVGEATISHNNSSIVVENELITPKVKIFITFRSNPNSFWWISSQIDGKFEVALSKVAEGDLIFDYWIVGIEEAPALEPEVAPAAAVAPVDTAVAPVVEPALIVPTAPVAPEVTSTPEPVVEVPVVSPPAPEVVIPVVEPAPEAVSPVEPPAEVAPVSNEVLNP